MCYDDFFQKVAFEAFSRTTLVQSLLGTRCFGNGRHVELCPLLANELVSLSASKQCSQIAKTNVQSVPVNPLFLVNIEEEKKYKKYKSL